MTPTAPPVQRPAVVVHLFLRAAHAIEPGRPEHAELLRWWRAGEALGMVDPVAPWPSAFPVFDPADRPRVPRPVAARQRRAPGAYAVLLVSAYFDVLAVSVLLAPNDDAVPWEEIARSWTTALGAGPAAGTACLGTADLLLGTLPGPVATAPDPQALTQPLVGPVTSVPGTSPPGHGPPDRWARADPARVADDAPGGGFLVWEPTVASPYGAARHRRLLALGTRTDEAALSRWAWQGALPGAAPATLLLLHSARLRDQTALLTRELPALDRLADDVERACDRAQEALAEVVSRAGPAARLAEAEAALAALGVSAGAGRALTAMAGLRQVWEAAERNLGEHGAPGSRSLTDADRPAVAWAREQSAVTQARLDGAARRAAECTQHLTSATERVRQDRRDHLSLVQTSLIGGLLTALAAIQSLQYQVRLPGPVRPALIAFLACAALVLPVLFLPRGDAVRRRFHGRRVDGLLCAAAGAATGWLLSAVLWSALHWRPAAAATLVAATLGALLAFCARAWTLRR
ncbi:CATRA conflict system CASPASE/TPR repeat-associated protein [Streptomyces erythrochromogenes]|uniref:CATRA conflict system CASPASE/TPR repeat-associated protein n=1 Tax=Streptomyces erythrochromogenes TaxID=285574 RepID=UPI0036C3D299